MEKTLTKWDVYLSQLCAILFADVIVSNSAAGPAAITYWLLLGVIFFIPNGFITAELIASYTGKGGIYNWVFRAYGSKWAARLSYLYWLNNALWMPSAFIWLSGALLDLFMPYADLGIQIIVSIVLSWLCVWIANFKMSSSKWLVNLGGISKVMIFGLVIIAGIAYSLRGNFPANDLSAKAFIPTFNESVKYLPVILYCCCGIEIISGNAHEMQNPRRDLSHAVVMVVFITMAFNIFASVSVLKIVPLEKLDLVTGLNDVLRIGLNSEVIANIAIAILLFSTFVQVIVWAIGCARGAVEAGKSGELPVVFSRENEKSGAPSGPLFLCGMVSTIILILYGIMSATSEDLFWTILAFATIVYFLSYVIMFPAYITLRRRDKNIARPIKAPFGVFSAVVCEIILIVGMLLFLWVPGVSFIHYSLPIIAGLAVSLGLGEIIIRRQIKKKGV